MKHRLLPLGDYQASPFSDLLTSLIQEAEGPLRQNRYHLKRFLSSNHLSEGPSTSRKTYELTQSTLDNPGSPRIIQKALNPFKSKMREKQIDQAISLKLANKNILRSIKQPSPRSESLKVPGIQLKIPDQLKALENECLSERSEIARLMEWYDDNIKTHSFLNTTEEEFLAEKDKSGLLEKLEDFNNFAYTKFFELLKIQCNERALMLGTLMQRFELIFKFKEILKSQNSEIKIKSLLEKLDQTQKDFENFSKKSSKSLKEVIFK
jgi:hypothetical protein